MDAAALRTMVDAFDEDLDASVVLRVGGEPAAIGLLGVRPPRGWIGGMGVVPGFRRQGLGRAVMHALLERARALGLRELQLEVLEQNEPAQALYRSLGFETRRHVEVWSVSAPAADTARPARWRVLDAAPPEGEALEPAPWQREPATLAHLAARPPGLAHVHVSDDRAEGGMTLRASGEALSLMDARGGGGPEWWAGAISAVLDARAARTLRVLNTEAGGVIAEAARLAGGVRDAGQWEMRLRLA